MPNEIKYVICPGKVRSRTDMDQHYIGYRQLIDLYKVDPAECVDVSSNAWRFLDPSKLIFLHPNYHGDYSIPKEIEHG